VFGSMDYEEWLTGLSKASELLIPLYVYNIFYVYIIPLRPSRPHSSRR
jgi:hypothetical protein